MVFNSNLDEIAFDSEGIRMKMKTRPLALKVYGDGKDSLKNSYLRIEEAVQQEFAGARPAAPPPARPAPPASALPADRPSALPPPPALPVASPAAPPSLVEPSATPPAVAGLVRPVARRSPSLSPKSRNSLDQIVDKAKGIIYCQAIFDAMGLTTEFMGVNQAKIVMYLTGVAKITATAEGTGYNLTVSDQHIQKFLEDPYGIRRKLNCRVGESHGIHLQLLNHFNADGDKGDRVWSNRDYFWRQLVPKGCFTDDTDQAVLKFHALKDANGDITEAVKLYATYLKDWVKGNKKNFFGKHSFGLGANTALVIDERNFTEQPFSASQKVWKKLATEGEKDSEGKLIMAPYFAQANGALMSSSYVLQFFPNSLELAQQATAELAKVTHYDPLVSAHCVAYVTMLYKLMHHQGELSDEKYKQYLGDSYEAGKKIFDERKQEYEAVYNPAKFYGRTLEDQLEIWDNQMYKAIYGEINYQDGYREEFKTWKNLELVYPDQQRGGDGVYRTVPPFYDNIGMSHRALSAGFFGLKKLRQYTLQD
ncbi:MAG: ADP-ribosylglycohydrolase family protein, partial [Alphaproteobacteria bacterium]